MIVDLPNTTISQVSRALVKLRDEGGAVALGRVLTLIIATDPNTAEEAIQAANEASREHPMRVIVVCDGRVAHDSETPKLDAEIRVGGDAGASEVIVLRALGAVAEDEQSLVMGLLLPDAPVVVWWPGASPNVPGTAKLGTLAQRRITDAATDPDPQAALQHRTATYTPGDVDLAWTRLTLWRAQLAAMLDQPPFDPVTRVRVRGSVDSPSATLLAAWLRLQLGAETSCELTDPASGPQGVVSVRWETAAGTSEIIRRDPGVAVLKQHGQPAHDVALPKRNLRDCLGEELRRLDPDELYGRVIAVGLPLLAGSPSTKA